MNSEKSKFLKIRLSSIHPSTALTFNIYVLINGHFTLYLRLGDKLTVEKLQTTLRASAAPLTARTPVDIVATQVVLAASRQGPDAS